ncbi:hypothetical protein FAVG1_01639 [Fusarium avenaceum]|nr:hypothetical protein FAVG1_01639 [Fusarium avenaceum]
MADPTQDNKVLHIPTDLYNALKAQCGNPGIMDLSSKASQDWKKFFSTAQFDEVRLQDTQKNIVVPIQALGAFRFNDEMVAARKAIRWVTLIVEGSQAIGFDPPSLRDSICPALPEHLAMALQQMTGLYGLCITLKHFTNEQVCTFVGELAYKHRLWPELHSLRIEAPPRLAMGLIMNQVNPLKIKRLHICDDIESMLFNKTLGIRQLDSHNTSERSAYGAGISSLNPTILQKISEAVDARIEVRSTQMNSEIAARVQAAVETQTAHQHIIFEQNVHQTAQTEMESQRSQLQSWVTHDLSNKIKPMITSTMKELKAMISETTKASVASELDSQKPEIEKMVAELVQAAIDSKMSSCISDIEGVIIRCIGDKVKKELESKLLDFDSQIAEKIRKATDKVKTLLAPLDHSFTHMEHISEPATDTSEIDSAQVKQEPVASNGGGVFAPYCASTPSGNEASKGQSTTGTKRSAIQSLFPGTPKHRFGHRTKRFSGE